MLCIANVSRMTCGVFGSLRLSGCEDETELAITESAVLCWPKVSGDGYPCCENFPNKYSGESSLRSTKSSLVFHP